MLQLQSIAGGYGDNQVIRDIDLEVQEGEFLTLLGPNGSGKSTLLKLMTGVLPLQAGDVLLNKKSIRRYKSREKARQMGVLSQEAYVGFDFTVEEIVLMGR